MPYSRPMRRASAAGAPMRHPTPDLHIRPSRAHARNVERLEQSAVALSESGSDLSDELRRLNRVGSGASRFTWEEALSRQDSRGSIVSRMEDSLRSFVIEEEAGADEQEMSSRNVAKGEADNGQNGLANDSVPPPSPPVQNDRALNILEGNSASHPRRHSNDTFREAELAFHDFDGVHISPIDTENPMEVDHNGNEVRRVSARTSSGTLIVPTASMLRVPQPQYVPSGPPPPTEGMVYYPAPVPRMLNLPKRLSQLPSAHVQAQRRSQALGQLAPEARQSAPWLQRASTSEALSSTSTHRRSGSSSALTQIHTDERMSTNLNHLPPQLRASVFFDQQPVHHDVEIQGESAVATLDSILEASATAPVNSFTDHPFAGDVRKSVYGVDLPRRSGIEHLASPDDIKATKRSSSIGALLKRRNTADASETLRTSGSLLTDLGLSDGPSKLKKRTSRMSLGDELEDEDENRLRTQRSQPTLGDTRGTRHLTDAEQIEQDFRDQEEQEDLELDAEPVYAQPTTLLAELQVRKAQLKSRTRTAATAFPNGMHSTLLQLDAVEEIAKKNRQHARVPLAWEDPHLRTDEDERDQGDDDVPLGMLFSAHDNPATKRRGESPHWDHSFGLMEKRALEDDEPLSKRRNRLRGVSPTRGRSPGRPATSVGLMPNDSSLRLDGIDGDGDEAGERRTTSKGALDSAISDITAQHSRSRSTFTDEVLSQFGGLDVKDPDQSHPAEASTTPAPEDETLGQRRARLQREREASGASIPQPSLNSRASHSNLLTGNPVSQRVASKNYQPAEGTLLHSSAQQQALQRNQILAQNMRSSSLALERTLVDPTRQSMKPFPGLLNSQQSRAPNGGFAGGAYNNGAGGVQFASPPPFSTPTSFLPQQQTYYGQPHFPVQYPQPSPMGFPAFGYPAQFSGNPMQPYGSMYGYGTQAPQFASAAQGQVRHFSTGMGMPGAPAMMAQQPEQPLHPTQRAAIDRWRMDIGQS